MFSLRKLSLTYRLTLFFTLVTAVVMLGLGWLFMQATERHFMELDHAVLTDKQQLIQTILTHANSPDDARWRLGEALGHHHGLSARVQSPDGSLLFESPDFHVPEQSEPSIDLPHGHTLEVWKISGQLLHALRFEARAGYRPDAPLQVLLATETTHHSHFLDELKNSLLLYALLATFISGLLGALAAHQGLAPLRAMKARAAAVSAQQLQERMPVEAVPVEMADLANALNQMLERLQQDFQRLLEFSSDLAHELRTPISNLLTQTQVTLASQRDAETYRDILASNAEELQRLARMVSDMLFLAKTERGVDLPHGEDFSADAEVRALIEFYEALAEEKSIKLHLQGAARIQGDRLMFRRALSNLLSNALRHTPQGGEVLIQIAHTEGATEVRVENTGADIPPTVLPRLFDRFYRADPARSHPADEGTGLGLPITQAIVQAHGGSVKVDSAHGRTRFSLTFPR